MTIALGLHAGKLLVSPHAAALHVRVAALSRRAKRALREAPVLGRFAQAAAQSVEDVRRIAWRRASRKGFAAYLGAPGPHRLHLGAGRVALPGWLNTDLDARRAVSLFHLDARRRFPFPDMAFDAVFSEHMIEHLDHADGMRMLRECRRVLKPGGVIRVRTPDLAVLLRLYHPDLDEIERRYIDYIVTWTIPNAPCDPVFVINNNFRAWGHRFLYDEPTLVAALREAGFVAIERRAQNESPCADLRGVDSHGRSAGHEEMVAFESMAFEARRP